MYYVQYFWLTVTSKDIPGLKYFGVLLKWRVQGDVTILIPLNSASTISLPANARKHKPRQMHTHTSNTMFSFYLGVQMRECSHSREAFKEHVKDTIIMFVE